MIDKNLYNVIDQLSSDQARVKMVLYIENQIPALSGTIDQAINTAYSIAGLMATSYARNLEDDDPLNEILTVAGELEIGADDASELRDELLEKISALRLLQ